MIRCNSDYKKILFDIYKKGNEVNRTYELLGQKVEIMLANTETIKEVFEISDEFEKEFISAICNFEKKQIGPYITEKYFSLIPDLKVALEQFVNDCNETRRAVISFPKEHCFQSIQFLIRENTINVICYMRSCDVINNLPYDAWLCYKLADILSHYLSKTTGERPYENYKVTMMFGSLHCYIKDMKNVFRNA